MAAAKPAQAARTARRVARALTDEYQYMPQERKEVSYRGGFQNSTQKLQWFWFGFKKYGFLANLANMCRMRESWWETGEKRMVGMDALGHRYWETDDSGRTFNQHYRWIDYPHHFHFADQAKLPEPWRLWLRGMAGRNPAQLEALHKELGPDWRDYLKHTPHKFHDDEADTHHNPTLMEGLFMGSEMSCPWDPNFKQARRQYGFNQNVKAHQITSTGITNLYNVDEFDPSGGFVQKLMSEGLGPDGFHQTHSAIDTEDENDPSLKFNNRPFDGFWKEHGQYDGGVRGAKIWWDYRKTHERKTKEARAMVSAFDNHLYSSKNTTGLTYAFQPRYKTYDPYTEEGYSKSKLNPKNHKRYSIADHQVLYASTENRELRDSYQSRI